MAQARDVQARLARAHNMDLADLPIIEIVTSGDRFQDQPLTELGGKGLFTKEIESALYDNRIDVAVHSMKDLETELPNALCLSAVLERADVRDAFISHKYKTLNHMPTGSVIGTSSVRRRAQLKFVRPDLKIVEFRGNVGTRLRKLEEGIADATFLACAGLCRLGRNDLLNAPIETSDMLPAIAQGAIALQIRESDTTAFNYTSDLNDLTSALCTTAERAFLAQLNGSCKTPIAGLAKISSSTLNFHGQILARNGSQCFNVRRSGAAEDAFLIGREAGLQLLEQCGSILLNEEKL